eukprot:CAMPEP_0181128948 /NCGR_PEP_ID=MMETSP1071-20121207/29052_1 /TAXON_ID=35127 /ORGANISM="Thalassiosira sp., Strain NH16" /LENGTH=284 /DNA_ID=CAMNT_0023214885 /DNA_START=333 /DNA_END=1187 /DNA_ORIENTATION=-
MALIATGICYKMFLYNYDSSNQQQQADYDRRRLGGDDNNNYDYNGAATEDDDAGYNYYYQQQQQQQMTKEQHEQDTANLFGRALALVLICTDLNLLLHRGKRATYDQILSIPPWKLAFLALSTVTLLFALVIMSYFQNDPHFMALFGLGAILCKDGLRRCFKSWQQEEFAAAMMTTATEKDDDGGGGGSNILRIGSAANGDGIIKITHTDDTNYQYEIERFENAETVLAKFEQQSIDDDDGGVVEESNTSGGAQYPMMDLNAKIPQHSGGNNGSKTSADTYYQL